MVDCQDICKLGNKELDRIFRGRARRETFDDWNKEIDAKNNFQQRSPHIPHHTKTTTPSRKGIMTCISCKDSKPIIGGQIKTIVGGLGYSTSSTTCK